MIEKLFDTPLNKSIDDLILSINEFKQNYTGYLPPENERQFLSNFKDYLIELDLHDKDFAKKVVKEGIRMATAMKKSVDDNFGSIETLRFFSDMTIKDSKKIYANEIFETAIITKDPERFSHDPGTELQVNKKARRHWYEHVQLNKHQIAKLYITRSNKKFSKDLVLFKYHRERKKKIGVELAFANTINWIKTSGKTIDQIYDEIGIQVNDKDSFNKEYNRWLKRLGTELS